ncbi:MAG TPA: hypothetical protein DDW52_11685 [Planctomycetaceae bacterium]|nr:hypothetical protein [Planctomycetaceae bacterium]
MSASNSPYDPPAQPSTCQRAPRFRSLKSFAFVVLPLLGGVAGFIGYIAAAIAIESRIERSPIEPVLPYGQTAAFLSLPLCTLVLASTGVAIALALTQSLRASIGALIHVFAIGSGITCLFWASQVRQFGRDPSEYVLFLPPLVCSLCPLFVAAIIALASLATHEPTSR